MPEMTPVTSSLVAAIGYDADQQEMHVQWAQGATSIYSGVPPEAHESVMNAPSIGRAVRAEIRDRYPHRYA